MTYININSDEKNYQAIVTTNTSAQTTSTSSNTYVTVNGSEITYTPVAGSNNVVYEIAFYVEALNKPSFQHLVLEHNTGSWATINVKFGKNFGAFGTGQYIRDYLYYRFVIPSWSGARQLRLRSAAHYNNYQVSYHQVTKWDGSDSITDRFCNTNLVVYSI